MLLVATTALNVASFAAPFLVPITKSEPTNVRKSKEILELL